MSVELKLVKQQAAGLDGLHLRVRTAQKEFHARLLEVERTGGLTPHRYARFLSMQYHLTRGVQRHFYCIAGNEDLASRRGLRKFLVEFANEEELHFQIAERDLLAMGEKPLPRPLDVSLWWAYFDSIVATRPFVRLGATAILENLSGQSQELISRIMSNAPHINQANSRFIVIHRHDKLPHGDQVLEALASTSLEPRHTADLEEGAETAMVLYFRLADWAFGPQGGNP